MSREEVDLISWGMSTNENVRCCISPESKQNKMTSHNHRTNAAFQWVSEVRLPSWYFQSPTSDWHQTLKKTRLTVTKWCFCVSVHTRETSAVIRNRGGNTTHVETDIDIQFILQNLKHHSCFYLFLSGHNMRGITDSIFSVSHEVCHFCH